MCSSLGRAPGRLLDVWPQAGDRGCPTHHWLSTSQHEAVPVSRWAEAMYRELPSSILATAQRPEENIKKKMQH